MTTPQEFYETVRDRSDKFFRDGHYPKGENHPMFIATLYTNDYILVIDAQGLMRDKGWTKDDVARAHQNSVNMKVGEHSVVASIFVTEAWTKKCVDEPDLDASIANDPEAGEAIVFALLTQTYEALMICHIAPDRKSIEKVPFRIAAPGDFLGRFAANRPTLH
jgi:hypothetical protein